MEKEKRRKFQNELEKSSRKNFCFGLPGTSMSKIKNTEIEIKFPLFKAQSLEKTLNKIAKKKKSEYQKDSYYIPAHRNFLKAKPIDEWLRLRETKNGAFINYKNLHRKENKKSIQFDEFESVITNLEAVKKIFQVLDFKEIIIVEKKRKTWQYKKTEIAIDMVKNLGTFIEIEAKGSFKDTDEAKKLVYQVLAQINAQVGEQDFKGYPYLVLEKMNYRQ